MSLDARHLALPTRGTDRWKTAGRARLGQPLAREGRAPRQRPPAASACACSSALVSSARAPQCRHRTSALPRRWPLPLHSDAPHSARLPMAAPWAAPPSDRPAVWHGRSSCCVLHECSRSGLPSRAHRHRLAAADTDSAGARHAAHTLECALDCRDGGLHRHGLIGLIRKLRRNGRLFGNTDRVRRRLYVAVRVSNELACVPTVPNEWDTE